MSELSTKQRARSAAAARTRFAVGSGVTIDRVVESELPLLDPLQIFPDATEEAIAAQMPWLAPGFYDPSTKLLIVPIQGFVLRAHGKIVVVDTCVGDCKKRHRAEFHEQRRNWLGAVAALGVAPGDVDYVICTHFHADHVGWNTRLENGRWVPTFPNARYLLTREEWDYWRGPDGIRALERTGDYLADSVVPIVDAGRADFVPMDHQVLPGIKLIPAAGHTPGFVCVDVRSEGQRVVLAGDLLHSPLQCVYPEWSTRFCADPAASTRTRVALLSEWADSGTIVMPTHFASPSAGLLERRHGAFFFRYTDEAP